MKEKELTYKEAYSRPEQIQALIESNRLDMDELSEKIKEIPEEIKLKEPGN